MTDMIRFPLSLLTVCLSAIACLGQAGNLIENGDFAQGAKGWPTERAGISYPIEQENSFMRLEVAEAGKMVMAYRIVSIPEGTEALEFSFKVRYQGIVPGDQAWFDGRIMMNFKDSEGKKLSHKPKAPYFRGTREAWEERSQKFLVTEGTTALELMPCLFNAKAGILELDDFKLEVIDAAAIQAQKVEKAANQRAKYTRPIGQPIIENGDFETDADGNGLPDGWVKKNSDTVSAVTEDGNSFLRLRSQEPDSMVMVYREFYLAPTDKALELTFNVRYADIEKGKKPWNDGRIIMHFKDADGKKVGPNPGAPAFKGTSDSWKTVSRKFLVPDAAVKMEFMPMLMNTASGTMDLDNFVLAPIDPDQIPKRVEMMSPKVEAPPVDKLPPELIVVGNQLRTKTGKHVWLQGVCIDSLEWSAVGERIVQSVGVAIDQWHANAIRLPIKENFWFGQTDYQNDGGEHYRQIVDSAVHATTGRGAYLILDLHRFRAPDERHLAFWQDAARRYANHPGVIIELFNEPHSISWEIWRNGGTVTDKVKPKDGVAAENKEVLRQFEAIGMQQLVEAVRETGARNLIIAGGVDWSYDISGVLKGYELEDTADGNGIMYSTHIYPWKAGWQKAFLDVAAKHPVFVGEVGNIESFEKFPFIPESQRYPLEGWAEDMIGCIQQYQLNWTAFSFHPRCGPPMLKDWEYTPTEYWGTYVKAALSGQTYTMSRMR